MRALILHEYGGPEALELTDVADPVLADESVILDVQAIGINFPDLLATRGLHQHKPPLPYIAGSEIAGIIREASEGSPLQPGDRAAAFVWGGGYAERAVVPFKALCRVAEGADAVVGAAMVVNYQTVHFALARRGSLRPGETLLVLGAAGGIGSAAVQVGKGLGARVIGGVVDGEQCEAALAAGADEALILTEGFSSEVRALTAGRGVDVVLDPVGDWLFTEATRALEPEGRILVIGFAAGEIPTLKVNRLLLRNISAVGVSWGAFLDVDTGLMASAAEDLNRMFADGFVRPQIVTEQGWEAIPSALSRLDRHEIIGKAVVAIAGGARS
jgi:NADPH:quinone reductase